MLDQLIKDVSVCAQEYGQAMPAWPILYCLKADDPALVVESPMVTGSKKGACQFG